MPTNLLDDFGVSRCSSVFHFHMFTIIARQQDELKQFNRLIERQLRERN